MYPNSELCKILSLPGRHSPIRPQNAGFKKTCLHLIKYQEPFYFYFFFGLPRFRLF